MATTGKPATPQPLNLQGQLRERIPKVGILLTIPSFSQADIQSNSVTVVLREEFTSGQDGAGETKAKSLGNEKTGHE